jgi:hypothetical protein
MHPPIETQAVFRTAGPLVKLEGGRGTAWRVGDVTLKSLDVLPEELLWLDEVAREHSVRSELRLSLPVRSRSGKLIADGFTAFPYLAGEHQPGRWLELAKIAREFSAIFAEVQRPDFVTKRTHAWAKADRFAWGEYDGPPITAPHVADLVSARRQVFDPPAIVHGDLTGNVLFDSALPPAVIDLTVYWRPVNYSIAVIAVDAVCFEGAPLSLLETISPARDFPQYSSELCSFGSWPTASTDDQHLNTAPTTAPLHASLNSPRIRNPVDHLTLAVRVAGMHPCLAPNGVTVTGLTAVPVCFRTVPAQFERTCRGLHR